MPIKFSPATLVMVLFLFLCLLGCKEHKSPNSEPNTLTEIISTENTSGDLLTDYPAMATDSLIHVLVEIPAGTLEKYELNTSNGSLQLDSLNGKPRIVEYIGYPGNYGMIPKTLLPKAQGGDGDPLDVIVLGPPAERGSVIKCKLIGILYLQDNAEQDDKLIAISNDSPLDSVNDLEELKGNYPGITEILRLWFTNYKGLGEMEFRGFGSKAEANKILRKSVEAYETSTD